VLLSVRLLADQSGCQADGESKVKYHYRTDGTHGSLDLGNHSLASHQIAFNAVARKLEADGWVKPGWQQQVRYDGKASIDGKKYPAISQGRILVVAGPMPPAQVQLHF
jgi:hypothetical protein